MLEESSVFCMYCILRALCTTITLKGRKIASARFSIVWPVGFHVACDLSRLQIPFLPA